MQFFWSSKDCCVYCNELNLVLEVFAFWARGGLWVGNGVSKKIFEGGRESVVIVRMHVVWVNFQVLY
jgi:hypothetical protein